MGEGRRAPSPHRDPPPSLAMGLGRTDPAAHRLMHGRFSKLLKNFHAHDACYYCYYGCCCCCCCRNLYVSCVYHIKHSHEKQVCLEEGDETRDNINEMSGVCALKKGDT